MKRPFEIAILLFAGLLGMVGCTTVGPDYKPPQTAAPTDWTTELQGGLIGAAADTNRLERWWTVFNDPVLSDLIEDLTQMELQVDVDETDVGQGHESQEATFTVDAYPDRAFPARITQVRYGSETTDGVVTYKTVLRVDNSSLALRPGMTATAVITVNKRPNALLVPDAALRFAPAAKTSPSGSSRSRGLVGMLLPGPPRMNDSRTEEPDAKKKAQQVRTVRDGQLVALALTKGLSDGHHTEVVSGQPKGQSSMGTNQDDLILVARIRVEATGSGTDPRAHAGSGTPRSANRGL